MRERKTREINERRGIGNYSLRVFRLFRVFCVLLPFAFTVFSILYPRTAGTHEPITTKVMFNKEIIRIFQRNCLGCHSPGKIKSDILLTTYEDARPWAKAIKEEILEKRMMPYQTVKGYGSFQHDYILPQRDQELMISWIEGGAPRGETKDYPREAVNQLIKGNGWSNGAPDLILQPSMETPIAAGNGEETRCLVIPTGLKQDRWINSIDFLPGNGEVVNSASIYIETPLDTKTMRRGDSCGASKRLEAIGHWVPGQAVNILPDGIARIIPANSRLVLKLRYRQREEKMRDRSSIGLYFNKTRPSKTIKSVTIEASPANVPANAERFPVKAVYNVNESTEAVSIRPILFPFAKSVEVTATRPDGTVEVLAWTRNYRYDWQPVFYYKKPVDLPKGTIIKVTAYLDNSDGNRANPNDPPKELIFRDPLCELNLTLSLDARTRNTRK